MSRIKLVMPEKFEFSTKIPVRITDINYGNHLGNDAILSLIHEARVQYLNNIELSELDCGGCGIIMVDSVILYKSQVLYGDALIFDVSVDEIAGTGCDFFYRLTSEQSGKVAALAKTAIVFYDYNSQKVSAVPDIFIERVNHLKNSR